MGRISRSPFHGVNTRRGGASRTSRKIAGFFLERAFLLVFLQCDYEITSRSSQSGMPKQPSGARVPLKTANAAGSLAEEQVRRYEDEGYVVLPRLLNDADMVPAREAMMAKVSQI